MHVHEVGRLVEVGKPFSFLLQYEVPKESQTLGCKHTCLAVLKSWNTGEFGTSEHDPHLVWVSTRRFILIFNLTYIFTNTSV